MQSPFYAFVIACLAGTSIAFIYSWRHAGTSRERAQLRIVALGAALGTTPVLLLSMVPRLIVGHYLVDPELSLLPIVVLPAAFGYAILRYQLMNLQLYVRKGLVYSTLALTITGIYAFFLFIGTMFLRDRSGTGDIVAVAVLSAVVALGGNRLRDLIQRGVDRLFDRRSYDYRQQLLEFSQRMNGVLNVDELAESTVEEIAETIGASHARLYLYEPATESYRLWTTAGIERPDEQQVLGPHHPLVLEVLANNGVVQHLDVLPEEEALSLQLVNKGQPIALLTLGPKLIDLPYSSEDISLLRTVVNQFAVATENAQLYARTRDLYLSGIRTLAATVDAKDSYTHGHSERVAHYARSIAVEMGLPQWEIETIELAGLLHDIGKIGVPDSVLQKPGRLDADERAMIMEHASLGAKILADNAALMPLVPLVRHHHEWYNGRGYPDGLKGDEIPLGAAIISVADTYDTMTTDRPYRKAPGRDKARAELAACAGTQFHPDVIAAMLRLLDAEEVATPTTRATATAGQPLPGRDPLAGRISAVDARAMHIVYRIAQMIGEVTDLDRLIANVVGLIRREIGAGWIDIYLVDSATGDLCGQTAYPGAVTGLRIPAGGGLVGWVARHQVPARVADVQEDIRTIAKSMSADQQKTGSELAIPLLIDGRTIGVIGLESRRTCIFTEDDEALLMVVAQQLAQVIEVAQLHDQLKRAAMADGLTGVANHRRFYERLETSLKEAEQSCVPLSVMMIDIDGLKALNDSQGHLVGDTALRALARILEREVRPLDTVARCGGDEFAIVLPGLGDAEATRFAEHLARVLADSTFEADERMLRLPSISWGVATYPGDGMRAMELVAVADSRMYRHKARHPARRDEYSRFAG